MLTVDLDAIVANWRKLEKTAVPAECAGVIKANAYGCGAEPVARALAGAGCKTFFVATLDEARAARAAVPSAAIYVLDGFFQNCGEAFAKIDARPVIGDLNELAEWDVFCRRSGWARRRGHSYRHRHEPARPHHHGGAGHHSADQCRRSRHHAGDEPPRLRRDAQSSAQCQAARGLPRDRAACSPACRRRWRIRPAFSWARQFQFDLVRPGAALYGINPTPEADNPMQPVVELKARIVQIRNIETRRNRRLWRHLDRAAADQACDRLRRLCRRLFPRRPAANDGTRGAEVVVAGKRCPIAGRISMDLIAVDVTDLDKNAARRGHMVTLIGEGITVDELAHHFGTIGYEVLTSLGRAMRIYKGGAARSRPTSLPQLSFPGVDTFLQPSAALAFTDTTPRRARILRSRTALAAPALPAMR